MPRSTLGTINDLVQHSGFSRPVSNGERSNQRPKLPPDHPAPGDFLYSSVNVDGEQVSDNAIAVANGKLIPFPTAVAKTPLYWFDTLGNDRPKYTGLGDRWQIVFKGE